LQHECAGRWRGLRHGQPTDTKAEKDRAVHEFPPPW
jgi:hypothetical protein